MGVGESLKEFYYSIEDKWYKFIDSVSEKVPAVGGFVDAIEEKGIPSFPVVILLIILLIIALFFLLNSTSSSTLSLTIIDDSKMLFLVHCNSDARRRKIKEDYTDASGKISFLLPNGVYSIKATKSEYTTSTKGVTLSTNQNDELILTIQDVKVTRAVYLKTAKGDLTTGYGRVFYRCKTGSDTQTKDTSYSNGLFNAELNRDCTEVEVISIENYSILNPIASFSGTGAVTVEKIEAVVGNASVTINIAQSTQTVPSGLK